MLKYFKKINAQIVNAHIHIHTIMVNLPSRKIHTLMDKNRYGTIIYYAETVFTEVDNECHNNSINGQPGLTRTGGYSEVGFKEGWQT